MSVKKAIGKLADMKAKQEALHKQFQTEGKGLLKEAFAEMFEENPEVKAVRWNQYTPHFNDGDACVFGVNEAFFQLDGVKDTAGDQEDGFIRSKYDLGYLIDGEKDFNTPYPYKIIEPSTKEEKALGKKLSDLLEELNSFMKEATNEEMFLAVFGDGCQITATRKGFEVEEYEHD